MTFSEHARKVGGSRPGRSSFGRVVRNFSSGSSATVLNKRRFKVGDDEAGLGIGIWEVLLERMESNHLCLEAEPTGLEEQLELDVAGMALVAGFSALRPFKDPLTERTASRDRYPKVRPIDP